MIGIANAQTLAGNGIWVPWNLSKGNLVPENAVIGGYDYGPIYVIRAWHKFNLIPGVFNPSQNAAYIGWEGEEIRVNDFEVRFFCKNIFLAS